eukprot:gene9855-biopygen15279
MECDIGWRCLFDGQFFCWVGTPPSWVGTSALPDRALPPSTTRHCPRVDKVVDDSSFIHSWVLAIFYAAQAAGGQPRPKRRRNNVESCFRLHIKKMSHITKIAAPHRANALCGAKKIQNQIISKCNKAAILSSWRRGVQLYCNCSRKCRSTSCEISPAQCPPVSSRARKRPIPSTSRRRGSAERERGVGGWAQKDVK